MPTKTSAKASEKKTVKKSAAKKTTRPAAKKAARPAAESTVLTLPTVPLRGLVAFPNMVLPLFIGREKSIAALQEAQDNGRPVCLVSQRDEEIEEPTKDDLFTFGVLADVMQLLKMPDGNVRAVLEAKTRARVVSFTQEEPYFAAEVEAIEASAVDTSPETEAMLRRLKSEFEQAVNMSKSIPPEAAQNAQSQDEIGALSDLIVSFLEIPVAERQRILEMLDSAERARETTDLLAREMQILEIDRELDSQVREGMNESQREYFLRERMKAIQEKLGERDSSFREAETLRQKIEAA